jgi:hypothetical protein
MVSLKIGQAEERGIFWGLIVMILYYAFLSPQYDFGVVQGNPLAYGYLWYLFNPIHTNRFIWTLTTMIIYFTMLFIQMRLVKKGKLSKFMVYLGIAGVLFCEMFAVQRDVTVIMFAPLASANPLFVIPMFLQKFGFNHIMWQQLTPEKAGIPLGPPAIFELQYVVLLFWFVFPTCVWITKRLWKRYHK